MSWNKRGNHDHSKRFIICVVSEKAAGRPSKPLPSMWKFMTKSLIKQRYEGFTLTSLFKSHVENPSNHVQPHMQLSLSFRAFQEHLCLKPFNGGFHAAPRNLWSHIHVPASTQTFRFNEFRIHHEPIMREVQKGLCHPSSLKLCAKAWKLEAHFRYMVGLWTVGKNDVMRHPNIRTCRSSF